MTDQAQQALSLFRTGGGGEKAHWYRINPETGEPECAYEILRADKKGYRATTLADARTHGLAPGSSAIINQASKPQLEAWGRERLLEQVIADLEGASKLVLAKGIKDAQKDLFSAAMDTHRDSKARAGTSMHAAVERWYQYGELDPDHAETVTSVRRALADLVGHDERERWNAEATVCSPLGFGGRIDLSQKHGWYEGAHAMLVDLKSKDIPPPSKDYREACAAHEMSHAWNATWSGLVRDRPAMTGEFCQAFQAGEYDRAWILAWKPIGYDNNCMQLAGYRHALGRDWREARCVNVFLARPPHEGEVRVWEWSQDQLARGWHMFYSLLFHWCARNRMPLPGRDK